MKTTIYSFFNENSQTVKSCPFCGCHYLQIKKNIAKCDSCKKLFLIKKSTDKEINNIILNNKSTIEEKNYVFDLLKNNVSKFSNRKNMDESLLNFLKRYYINIEINKELNYKNIFDFLKDTKYEDCHCRNINCNKETKFVGFRSLKRFPKGYHSFCSEKCFHEWFSKKQLGINNTLHRMDPNKIDIYHKKLSDIMKEKIKNGEFKPAIINSWRRVKYRVIINGEYKYFRSSWEAFFNIVNPNLEYEKRRLQYEYKGDKHTYTVDFEDPINKILYEIKPSSIENNEINSVKKLVLIDWCNKNNYKFLIINDNWFKENYSKYKYLLEDQPEKELLMKNLRYYENKINKKNRL